MMFIKRTEYGFTLEENTKTLATFNDFTTAAMVCRFIKAGRLEKPEYDIAVKAMRESDIVLGYTHGKEDADANTEQAKGITGPSNMQDKEGSSGTSGHFNPHHDAVFV